MLMYLTHEEYVKLGGELDNSTFMSLQPLATAKLDYWTFNRITQPDERVKLCMKLITDTLYEIKTEKNKVLSVSNDGISMSYAKPETKDRRESDLYLSIIQILPISLISTCLL